MTDFYTSGLVDAHGRLLAPGGASGLVRQPGGDLAPTVFPLPVRPLSELTVQMRRQAIGATYTGRIEEAADLYRDIVTGNGYFSGMLATMAQGILGMPRTFQGRADMVTALDDAGGTPGEYKAQYPGSEAAQVFADGIGFGIGAGEIIYSAAPRAPGANRIGRLEWRDPRWLWRNTISLQWYQTKRDGMKTINPGDGRTFLFMPYPDLDAWRHGPWVYLTLAGIFASESTYDRQRVSEVTTPTPVMRAEKSTSKEARKEALERLKDLAHDHRIVLPEQWIYEIVSASGEYNDIATSIVEWATGMVEVGLTGNMMGMKAQSAFTDANVYKRTTTDRRRFYAECWCDTVRRDGLVYWGEDNYGDHNVPIMRIDVESPEDKLAKSKADEQEGVALKAYRDGLDAVGYELEPEYVQERAQARGVRIRPLPGRGNRVFTWDAATQAAFVTIGQAIADAGLPALPPGDPRASMMVAAALKPGGDRTPTGATASPPASSAATPSPPTSSSPAPTTAPPAPAARLEEDDADGDEEDARLAARADAMNAQGLTACRHNRTNLCRLCGVRGHWMPDGGAWRVSWEPLQAHRARLGAAPAPPDLDAAEQQLAAALAALDALDEQEQEDAGRARLAALEDLIASMAEDDPALPALRARAEQERGPDGRFAPGGGGPKAPTHDTEGRAIVKSAGTKHGFGTSKAAAKARGDSTKAQEATAKAKAGGSHLDAAKAHLDAAAQHREAAARSARPDYRAAHEAAAKAHEAAAKAHAAEAQKAVPKPTAEKRPAAPLNDKQRSAAHLKELRAAADKATKLAEKEPTQANHAAAAIANSKASQAGSSHYVRFGGGLAMHDKNEENRSLAMHHEGKAKAIAATANAKANAEALERAKDPRWQAAKLGKEAEALEHLAHAAKHPEIYRPGINPAQNRAQRQIAIQRGIETLEKAHALDPAGGYKERADDLRKRHADALR